MAFPSLHGGSMLEGSVPSETSLMENPVGACPAQRTVILFQRQRVKLLHSTEYHRYCMLGWREKKSAPHTQTANNKFSLSEQREIQNISFSEPAKFATKQCLPIKWACFKMIHTVKK